MSIYRVITRILPLNSSESTFEPASFEQLTDGNVREVKVLELTEPNSGMKYRIERVVYVQTAGPGETVESLNNAYAEKLQSIPGFTQLKPGDTPLNPYDKSFQVTLPKVISGNSGNCSQQDQSSESFKISVVKNFKFKKASPKKKKVLTSATLHKPGNEVINYNKSKSPQKFVTESKAPFKSKYPSYLTKKIKNSVWKKKKTSPKILKSKLPNSKILIKGFAPECATNGESKQNSNCPTSNYLEADRHLDARTTFDLRILNDDNGEKAVENHDEPSPKRRKISLTDDEETDFTDNSLGSECGELVINVPEAGVVDASDKNPIKDAVSESLDSSARTRHDSSTSEDSLLGAMNQIEISQVFQESESKDDSSQVFQACKNKEDSGTICRKYVISEDNPAHDLLVALKSYFLNGECIICGFIPADSDFNACDHMESHVLCNSVASSYRCICCDDKFPGPRDLYEHSLSREQTYNYICSICTLKFKRRHYLLKHTSKSH